MEKKIAIVRLHRGVLDPITQVNKLMTFICDIEDVKKGDLIEYPSAGFIDKNEIIRIVISSGSAD